MTSDLHALVITADPQLLSTFTNLSRELGIAAEVSESQRGIPAELQHDRYEALLVDFDNVQDAGPIVKWLRTDSCNSSAVVFAVASGMATRQDALLQGANFAFERPVEAGELRRALWASYALMTEERRRYFRAGISVPVEMQNSEGIRFQGESANVSSQGLCVAFPGNFEPGESVKVTFTLPGVEFPVEVEAVVVWDDKHGKSGLKFSGMFANSQRVLDTWLDNQFKRTYNS